MLVTLHSDTHSHSAVLRSVVKTLKSNHLWSMATSAGRRGHVNTAYYCHSDDLLFYFVSERTSAHVTNFFKVPNVAVAIFDSRQPWDSYHRGLQLFGTCREARGALSRAAFAAYAKRFPDYAKYIKTLSAAERRKSSYRFYEFSPTALKVLDERVFGEEVFVSATIRRNT